MEQLQEARETVATGITSQAEQFRPHPLTMHLGRISTPLRTDQLLQLVEGQHLATAGQLAQFVADANRGGEEPGLGPMGGPAVAQQHPYSEVPARPGELGPEVAAAIGLVSDPGLHQFVETDLARSGRVHLSTVGVEQERQQHLQRP